MSSRSLPTRSPPTLQYLTEQRVLKDEALAISILDDLPSIFFPQLFKEAFNRRLTKLLRAMVPVWPLPYLPLGALMKKKTTCMKTFRAVLQGIDMLLLGNRVSFRRCKLEALDLRIVPLDFWNSWCRAMVGGWSLCVENENQAAVVGRLQTGVKQPLKIVIDLDLKDVYLDRQLSYLIRWAEPWKGLLRLCCSNLKIGALSLYNYVEILRVLDLDYIQELHLHSVYNPAAMVPFAPYLGRMSYLRRLFLFNFWEASFFTPVENQQIITQFTSQLLKLDHLRELCVDSVHFLQGHLDQLLWWVKMPLETLSVVNCKLSESEWRHLAEFPCTSQLKHLTLKNVSLAPLSPEPLKVLLVKVAATLTTLSLEDCRIGDAKLTAFLTALSHCSQLMRLNFQRNQISMSVLKDLLRHTAGMSQLRVELYPAPLECYQPPCDLQRTLFQYCDELMGTLKSFRKPERVMFGINSCYHGEQYVYDRDGSVFVYPCLLGCRDQKLSFG